MRKNALAGHSLYALLHTCIYADEKDYVPLYPSIRSSVPWTCGPCCFNLIPKYLILVWLHVLPCSISPCSRVQFLRLPIFQRINYFPVEGTPGKRIMPSNSSCWIRFLQELHTAIILFHNTLAADVSLVWRTIDSIAPGCTVIRTQHISGSAEKKLFLTSFLHLLSSSPPSVFLANLCVLDNFSKKWQY